ncbi:DUF1826 domain-containing protein [Roseibium denhamense]|uniref:DUF1826 domain-containing protein n=1 Tax=Roseibium denhamense TaxID=76305 RepID=A0ABY1NAN2_9HYPH|nr:DUF1826 domain-containing protein [Roseibium denhamense]MTI05690.1 DUF1826 domain-containing protein [Roseibium denhamense]SMP04247.1 Protein of unknown function [Roseibium denhamense]
MTVYQEKIAPRQRLARDVLIGRDPDILSDIASPGVAAAIWSRNCDPGFQAWIDGLPEEQLPDLRTVIPFHLASSAVLSACQQAGTPHGPELDMLSDDVGALALMLAKTLDIRQVRVRLDVATGVMCPKFHIDNVPARLLCTYRGAGTEYVPAGFEMEPSRIRQVNTGHVALFRGQTWLDEEKTGLLHRSPGRESDGKTRLLLVIDAVS